MPRSNKPSARLFVAAYPPSDAAEALLRHLHTARSLAGDEPRWRPTPSDMLHMTLLFLGPVPASRTDATAESLERACAGLGPLTLTPARLITLPPKGRPRVIAAETNAPAPLPELRARLVRRLASKPRANPSDRFTPHFTLARYAHQGPAPDLNAPLDGPAFSIHRIHLMRSVLRPDGSVHTSLADFELRGDG